MAAVRKPKRVTLRGRWLGQRLRDLREAEGRTIEEVADYLQRAMGTVSRFETGIYPIRRTEVVALLDLYGANDPKLRANLLKIADDVWQTGWWEGYANDVVDWLIDFVWLEELAIEHWLFQSTVVPGILQTEPYARALVAAANPEATDEQMERWVELRIARQALLSRENPPSLRVVLDESVLRRHVGSSRMMRSQLQALNQVAEQDHMDIRVLTYEAGSHATLSSGSFAVYRMEDPYPEVGYVETPKGALYIETPDSDSMMEMYDRLWEVSLSAKESAEFISTVSKELT
ncbi:helix-turn-helix transcriptional regulator [Nocardiopsis tropica]|uniref:Helix-turn-helix transcriptional regulator n=1 Tax=Nocardiopsis tropica TaxID=109330 RepID=A0ABU7KN48_9ACTN|nr:helix-turn-helix transcriptional regulator [Nocardiopsis umidischolae]MEE2050709.1 helix-turn-helix transcriptional regulator [Nocardiopsis umidischolae]